MKVLSLIRVFISGIALFATVYGLLGFLYNSVIALEGVSNSEELSLDRVQGIIVKDSAIYIGLGGYSRIQKYNHEGVFLTSWDTHTHSKDFTFMVNEYGFPEVLTDHLNRRSVKKIMGSEHIAKEAKDALLKYGDYEQALNPTEFIDKNGVRYYIKGGFSKVLIREKNGKKEVLIEKSILKDSWSGTFIPWLIGLVGIVTFFFVNILLLPKILDLGDNKLKLSILFKEVFTL